MLPGGEEDRRLWRETARRFLEAQAPVGHARALIGDEPGYDRALYRRMAELGWMAPMAPVPLGGGSVSGFPFADLAVVVEEMGRTLTPAPVVEANLVVLALSTMASPPPGPLIEKLVSGETTVSVATGDPGGDGWNSQAQGLRAEAASGGGWRLVGTRAAVAFGQAADLILTTAQCPDGGVGFFLVPSSAPGLGSRRMETLDLTRPLARVEFDGVELGAEAALGDGLAEPAPVEAWLAAAVALQAADTAGALSRVLDLSVDYARERKAFGRPIGSFQAVKHRLADMVLWLEWTRAASALAVQAADEWLTGGPLDELLEAASVAKAVVGEFGPELVRSAVQVHGGIGYTWEHDVHLYLRRVEANAALLGTTDFHRDQLAGRIGLPHVVAG